MEKKSQPDPSKNTKDLLRISESKKPMKVGNLGKSKFRGAQVKDLLGDHLSLDNTCPSTKISQVIRPAPKRSQNQRTKIL